MTPPVSNLWIGSAGSVYCSAQSADSHRGSTLLLGALTRAVHIVLPWRLTANDAARRRGAIGCRAPGGVEVLTDLDLPRPTPMFARSLFQTPDMDTQHKLLGKVAAPVDAGVPRTTLTRVIGPINAENLRVAHELVESGRMIGKVVLEGF